MKDIIPKNNNLKATAVLLRWKRNDELKQIIENLKQHTDLIDEIIIWDNRESNMCGYGRYLATLEAKNDIIYTQDDDCLIHNIPELFKAYDDTCIVNNLKKQHLKLYAKYNHTLPGWGMMFNKKWISCLNKYIRVYGVDEIFLRDTGRIFTGLFGNWKSILGDIEDLPSATDKKMALYLQDNHLKRRDIAVKRIDICNANPIKVCNYKSLKQ